MKSKKQIALFIGINATGHLNSLLGIADKLKDEQQFHTVFLVRGPLNVTAIEKHGHELLVITRESSTSSVTSDPEKKYATKTSTNNAILNVSEAMRMNPKESMKKIFGDENGIVFRIKNDLIQDHEVMKNVIKDLNPNLVVLDTWYIPPCILKLECVPWVYICSANPLTYVRSKIGKSVRPPPLYGEKLFTKEEREKMRQNEPEKWKILLEGWKSDYESQVAGNYDPEGFKSFYLQNGIEPYYVGPYGYFSPYLNLYQFPKEIDYAQEDDLFEYPERWLRCDSFNRKSVDEVNADETKFWTEKLNEAMKGKKEMIYFSLGTLASGDISLMKRFIDMFATDTERLYVISKGINGDLLELNPENMIGGNYLPQNLLLKRANLAIVHGGNNTITECLYHGVPMIVLPCFGDQYDNAQRIEDVGLGKRLRVYDCSKEKIFKTLEEVIYDSLLLKKLKEIAKNMQSRNDLSKIAFILRKLAEEKQLTDEFIEECKTMAAAIT